MFSGEVILVVGGYLNGANGPGSDKVEIFSPDGKCNYFLASTPKTIVGAVLRLYIAGSLSVMKVVAVRCLKIRKLKSHTFNGPWKLFYEKSVGLHFAAGMRLRAQALSDNT